MKTYIHNLFIALAILALNSQLSTAFAQGTAFTYQGRLNNGSSPANGSYDLTFTLYTTNATGLPVAGPLTNSAVAVMNGLFTTLVDFGPNVFTGTSNWLEVAVSPGGANNFMTLAPRQQLTPAPYALFAEGADAAGLTGTIAPANIGNGSISSNLLAAGSVGVSQLATNIGIWTQLGTNIFYTNGYVSIGTLLSQAPLLVRGNGADNSASIVGFQITGGENGSGVFGYSQLPNGSGVKGEADLSTNDGGFPAGVWAVSGATNGVALYAEAPNGSGSTFGVSSIDNSPNGYAGYFQGRGYFSGNVGIGTTAPSAPLDVVGSNPFPQLRVAASSNAPYGSFLAMDATATTGGKDYLIFSTGGAAGEGVGKLVFQDHTDSKEIMSLTSAGNVGIGTVNPAATLHVSSPGIPVVLADSPSTIGTWVVLQNTSTGGTNWHIISTGLANGEGPGKLLFDSGAAPNNVNANTLTLQPDGTVGIGTTSPGSRLQVAGTFIAGGPGNGIATNINDSTIAGGGIPGFANLILGESSFIGAGNANTISSNLNNSFIGAGYGNYQAGVASFIGAGNQNSIQTNSPFSVIGGGNGNTIQSSTDYSFIGGGQGNTIANLYPTGTGFVIVGSTIGGGLGNTVAEYDSFVGGGQANYIGAAADHSTIAGGGFNTILGSSGPVSGFIGGGQGNYLGTNLAYAAIGGGISNVIQSVANDSAIVGGIGNNIQTNSPNSFIGGGYDNTIQADSEGAFIGGGEFNSAGGFVATVLGGFANNAMAQGSVVLGGGNNIASGTNAVAVGSHAVASNFGSFVFADSLTGDNFSSAADNSFNVRARGGVAFVTSGAGVTVDGKPVLTSGSIGAITQANLGTTNSYPPAVGNGTLNFTTTTQSGYYAKVGNLVYFEAWVVWSGKGLATSGNLSITLPPVPVASPRPAFNVGYVTGITGVSQLIAISGGGGTSVSIDTFSGTTGNTTGVPVTSCATTGEIQITGTYRWQ